MALISTLGLLLLGVATISGTHTIQRLQTSDTKLADLKATMLTLRRHEKDFLMRLDAKYAGRFNDTLKTSQQELQQLSEMLGDGGVDAGRFQQMKGLLNDYGERFNSIVSQQQAIGFDSKLGLYGGLRESIHTVEEALTDSHQANVSMLTLRRHEKDFMLRRDLKYVGRFQEEIFRLKEIVSDSDIEGDQIEVINQNVDEYARKFNTLIAAEKRKGLDSNSGDMGEMREAVHKSEALFTELKKILGNEITVSISNANNFLISMILIVAAVVVVCTGLVATSIFRPLSVFRQEIIGIIDNKDLTVRLSVTGKDEIADVAHAFNMLLESLHEMIGKIDEASMMVASSAEEMSTITREVERSSESQTIEVEQAAAAVNEMSATAHEIARNATSAADNVKEIHEQLQEGVTVSGEARDEIQRLTEEVQGAVLAIQELEKNSKNIGQVLDAIQNVAEQTNLLALNAAIEAARAGEQGRGFAVVADEVRTLAQRTQESTETIRQTITEFQEGTNHVVSTVSSSNQRAESGIARVTRSSDILTEISAGVSSISDMNIQVAAAAEQQGATSEEISRNVTKVADLSRGVKSQTEQTSQASAELAQLGTSLRAAVSEFKV